VIAIVHDVPVCNAISSTLVIGGLNFTTIAGGTTVGFLTSTPAVAPEVRLNLTQLRDFDTILLEAPVTAGSYAQATLNIVLSQLTAYDPTMSPPVHNYSITLSSHNYIFTINPPLIVTPNQANVISLDFNMLSILGTDSSGNLNGQVTPATNITQLQATNPTTQALNPNGFAELDDLWGFVRSVSTLNNTSNPTYKGSFQLQMLSPSEEDAPEVPVNLTASTNTIGFADLGHLLPDSYVEVDGILDAQGNLAANTVEVQAVENPFPTGSTLPSTALIGPIVAIQTDQAGNPTGLNLWVHDAEPDDISTLVMDNIYQVDLTTNPTYQASALGPNFANLSFNPQNLAVGQELVIHGAYVKPPHQTGQLSPFPFIVEPTAIYLKLQSMQGTVASMLQIGSDNETGVFVLNPCCTLLQGTPIYVVTNNQTTFTNVTGLTAITPVNTLLIRGMPYYEPQAVNVNGVSIPAGTMVVQAKQVHVLQ
jgi:hypothetical protein